MSTSPRGPGPGALRRLWFRWKALRLPWRKKWFCGAYPVAAGPASPSPLPIPSRHRSPRASTPASARVLTARADAAPPPKPGSDLAGNTYWEFKDAATSRRARRIVRAARRTPLSDLDLPPQWTQWLRHARPDPPALADLARDVARQARLRELAAAADARWAARAPALGWSEVVEGGEGGRRGRGSGGGGGGGGEGGAAREVEVGAGERMGLGDEVERMREGERERGSERQSQGKDDPWAEANQSGGEWQPQSWTPAPARRE
ncbi:hypothetical protein BDY21DRAFT_410597 [Lineolata rhizophorae]|uniref:Uncharacterized protein n=1 Tax=Lineolata rhizophorae TaxID=578093 RepID=A0A6A6P409_9PEZI|nr:hypothetical protein BDY21DRAFT_410597 [Lineolata rhizophorae]